MSTRKDDIEALLENSQTELSHIEQEYQNCLEKQEISASLKIKIKSYCENLRSILDYIAHDIREKHCLPLTKKDKIYFPISAKLDGFQNNINKWYPDLKQNFPDLYNYLLSVQSFSNPDNLWIIWVNEINNKNKHNKLVCQTSWIKKRRIAGTFNLGETHTVHLNGENQDKIKIAKTDKTIETKIIPTNYHLAKSKNTTKLTSQVGLDIFLDFKFEGISNISALDLLIQSHQGIQQIYTDISKWLYQ